MSESASRIRERAAAVRLAGKQLKATALDTRIAWLVSAAARLTESSLEARQSLASATGLSPAMVEWGARTTLATVDARGLRALHDEATVRGESPVGLLSLVLAGNLFTASVRGILVPLLLGVPVLAKASSRDRLFPAMLVDALCEADPNLGAALGLVFFSGADEPLEEAFVDAADTVAVYGSDETVSAIRERHPEVPLIAHGHGVSAAYCGPDALSSYHVAGTLESLALDICAYDQRGCLSPQIVYVDERAMSAESFATQLGALGLAAMEERLPRGPLPIEVGAAQAQWRGLAEVAGTLVRGDTFAIAAVGGPDLRWSPGYRNVSVVGVDGPEAAVEALSPLGPALKCVGVDEASRARLGDALARRDQLGAYLCSLGTMQTPALDAPADGKPIWHGLLR